jgi:hypothetical protein
MTRFVLQGSIYYTQHRKCGKPTCTDPKSDGHGPYWYRRDRSSGKVHYIGKKLPERIAATHAAQSRLRLDASRHIMKLRRHQQALRAFVDAEFLDNADIEILTAFDLEEGIL